MMLAGEFEFESIVQVGVLSRIEAAAASFRRFPLRVREGRGSVRDSAALGRWTR